MARFPRLKTYELCERAPFRMCSEKNPVVGAPFNSEAEALEWGRKYGFSGDNYYAREQTIFLISTEEKTHQIPLVHKKCGTIVFYTDYKPSKGDHIASKDVRLPDGSTPKRGDPIVCPKCGVISWGISSLTLHPDFKEDKN